MTETQNKTPVTVLTGFLGSGKTTLLNRILSENHGQKYAVIVNEFGEIGIDNDLIVQSDEEIYEMNNGCVCCTVRGDLIRVLQRLMRRSDRFDAVIVETTGLADPAPVAQTFFMDDDVRETLELDAVIALADAKHLIERLDDTPEAHAQIGFADVVLLNKVDLVNEAELAAVETAIKSINPLAELHKTERSQIDMQAILGRHAFDVKRVLERDPHFLDETDHHDHHEDHGHHDHECGENCTHDHHHSDAHGGIHGSDIGSISLSANELNPDKFFHWINEVTQSDGPDILRLKGILAFENDDERYVIQGVHMIVEGDHQRAWADTEQRKSRLVFIGRNLDRTRFEARFNACKAS